jgi:hypothetical protein
VEKAMREGLTTTKIPWENSEDWSQVEISVQRAMLLLDSSPNELTGLVQQIAKGYTSLESRLNRLCLATCNRCTHSCCISATIWYDLKDLLFNYLNTGLFPPQQIYRQVDGTCCNLTPSGCRIDRSKRPFICTWYICANQKESIKGENFNNRGFDILSAIAKIQRDRKELETEFINGACNVNMVERI